MVLLEKILASLAEITARIDEEVEKGYDLSDWKTQMSLLHALQIQAQMLIDIAQRACSLLGKVPETYGEAGDILLREGVISEDERKLYRAVVGFRNVVVHAYLEVDLKKVDEILRGRMYRKVLDLAEKIVEKMKELGHDP